MNRFPAALMLLATAVALMGAADGSWLKRVSAVDRARTNPLPDQHAAAEAGGHVYTQECARCHGEQAQGKGSRPTLISPRIAGATDGELYWILKNGNPWKGMPAWSSMPDNERWQLVSYMRSLNTAPAVTGPAQ